MRKLIPSWIRIPVAFLIILAITEYFVDSGGKPAFIEYTAVQLFLILVLLILIAIEAVLGALENIMLQKLDEEAKARFLAEQELGYKFTWIKETYTKLCIKELDNNLPPWWVYAFYISIVFAIGYLLKYEVFNGDNQIDELETELAEARIAIEEYKKTAKDLVDFNTVTLLTDASDLKAGKTIFETNCVACHMADGGGGIGPNLTDKNWILGGDVKHVFKTISEGGRSGKGMIAWKAQLKPAQIAQVASYVLSLQGTTPANPKEPQGDVWEAETAETAQVN